MGGGHGRAMSEHDPRLRAAVPPEAGGKAAAARADLDVLQGSQRVLEGPGTLLAATLGSCIAVCLHDPAARRGGMNHIYRAVDPGPLGGDAIVSEIERLVNAMMRLGSRRGSLRAHLVGGAHILPRGRDVGAEISDVCLRYLAAEDVPVCRVEIGGDRGRRATFCPATGRLATRRFGPVGVELAPTPRRAGPWELF